MHSRRSSLAAPLLLLALMFASPRPALAVWSTSGNAVASASNVDETFRFLPDNAASVCSDGRGGLISVWVRAGQDSVMVQRLDRTGARAWNGSTGVWVSAATTDIVANDVMPSIVSDTDGGCWVAWFDNRSGASGIYVQHLDADGAPQLTAGGLRVSVDSPAGAYKLPLALTASKKLLVGWVDIGTPDTVQVQRVRTNGTLDWGAGLAVTTFDGGVLAPTLHRIFADGEGVVVLWEIESSLAGNSFASLFGKRFDATGAPLWGAASLQIFSGTFVTGTTVTYSNVGAVDGAWDPEQGLWVAWLKSPGGVCVQRVSVAGALQFAEVDEPMVIGSCNTSLDDLAITTDGGTGLIVGWLSGSTNTSVFAQRVSSGGTELWGAGDVLVASGAGARDEIEVVTDAAGGAYVVYTDTAPGANLDDVVVKRLDESGGTLWSGLARTTSTSGAERAGDAVPDGAGGLLLAWEDDRDAAAGTGTTDIYAKHFEADGSLFVGSLALTSPNGGESYESLIATPVAWSSNHGGEVMLTYTVDGGAPVTIVTATPDDGSFTWFPPAVSTSNMRMQISIVGEPTVTDESNATFRMCATLNLTALIATSVFTPYDLQTADFNEDDILDLVVAGASGVSVLLGSGSSGVGNGSFGAPVVYLPGSARHVAVGDFDEDGILDLAVAHAAGVSTLRGVGTADVGNGTFAAAEAVAGLSSAADILAADLDNDGVLDLAVADSVGNRVAVFRGEFFGGDFGDGNGDFDTPVYFATGTQPGAVAAGDVDEDGDIDLVTTNVGSQNVTILRNSGASGFGAIAFTTLVTAGATARPNAVAVHDIDEDGDGDVIVGTDLGLSIHHNGFSSGVPFFETRQDIVGLPVYALAIADINRNGVEDVLAVGPASAMQVYFGGGSTGVSDGTFSVAGALGTGGAVPGALVAADFNEDGRTDVAFGNLATNDLGRTLGGCNSIGTSAPTLATPDGGEVWTPNTLRTLQWSKPTVLSTVDLDVSRDGGSNWEPIARQVGGTQFAWKVTHPITETARVRVRAHDYAHRSDASAASFTICGPYDSVATPSVLGPSLDLVLVDVDRDGILDLAQAIAQGLTVRRGLGAAGVGDGSFGPETLYAARDSSRAVARIDWDREHGDDLAIVTDRGLEVWASDAEGRLARVIDFLGSKFSSLAVGDVDQDGDEDLVACSDSARRVVYYRHNFGFGGGGFSLAQTITSSGRPSSVGLGDFDEDGDLDMAYTTFSGAQALYRAVFNGVTFLAPVALAAGEGLDLSLADLDEDDVADIAFLTPAGASMCRGVGSFGTGTGNFLAAQSIGTSTTGRCITTADWNADGRIDVMVAGGAGFLGGNIRLYYGLGAGALANGTFAREELMVTGIFPTPLLFGDVLEDGRLDMIVGLTDRLVVALGACSDPPGALSLTTLTGGEAIQGGVLRDLTWTKPTTGHPVDLALSLDDGGSWRPIANEVAGTRFRWQVPGVVTQTARVRVQDSRLHNTDDASDFGFVVYADPLDAGGTPTLGVTAFAAPRPNPSRGRTLFALTLPERREARVEVYDLAGRHVRTLATGERAAGEHRLVWDGRDDSGRVVGAGVYLARARVGETQMTRQFVRLD